MMTQREFFVLKLVSMVEPDIRIYHECTSGIENPYTHQCLQIEWCLCWHAVRNKLSQIPTHVRQVLPDKLHKTSC